MYNFIGAFILYKVKTLPCISETFPMIKVYLIYTFFFMTESRSLFTIRGHYQGEISLLESECHYWSLLGNINSW